MSKLTANLKKKHPTPYKKFFKDNNIFLTNVARHLGLSYSYCVDLINGNRDMPDYIAESLDILVEFVKANPEA